MNSSTYDFCVKHYKHSVSDHKEKWWVLFPPDERFRKTKLNVYRDEEPIINCYDKNKIEKFCLSSFNFKSQRIIFLFACTDFHQTPSLRS